MAALPVQPAAEKNKAQGRRARSRSSFTAHTFDSNLSVTSHTSQELPRRFDGSQSTPGFTSAFVFRPLPPLKIRTAQKLSLGLSKSFDGVTSVRDDADSWIMRREPTARLEQELDVFLSGLDSRADAAYACVRVSSWHILCT